MIESSLNEADGAWEVVASFVRQAWSTLEGKIGERAGGSE